MLVSKFMQVLSNLFGSNKKINANDVAVKKNNKGITLDNYLDNLNEYSTDERLIGKWIDGKPLYRKVIIINTTLSSNELNNFPHNIENVDFIFVEKAFVVVNDANNTTSYRWSYPLPVGLYNSNTDEDKLSLFVSRWGIRFFVQTSWGVGWSKYVVLNYTKTTD